MHFEPVQWVVGFVAAFLIGVSKTGIPGVGILVVSLLAWSFGGWASVGLMLPMLIFADCFALMWYRQHVHWDKLLGLLPWIVTGLALGGVAMWMIGQDPEQKGVLDLVIGIIVLLMIATQVLRNYFGEQLSPKSKIGMATTGTSAGFATMVSNAAGPIMQIYMSAHKLRKEEFMGTLAWYFFIINASKFPVFVALTLVHPKSPLVTWNSLKLDCALFPGILVGALLGKWLFSRVSQKLFNALMLILAGLAAVKLILDYAFPGMLGKLISTLLGGGS